MADLVITVDTGEAVCNTSKWQEHYRISIVNMLKEFQPGLSQGIYEALAWEGLINCAWDALSEADKNLCNKC
jgi:phosphoribosylformimino-5-aminoimidazole carboxamide ribonucleotide (ProFAR) isomerase